MRQVWIVEALSAVSFRKSAISYKLRLSANQRRCYGRSSITMMPEGPEVRTVVDQLQGGVGMQFQGVKFLSGRYVRHGPPNGYDEFSKTLGDNSDEVKEWNTKGKFIYMILEDDNEKPNDDFQRSIWITLGMTGRFVAQSMNSLKSTEPRWAIQLRRQEKTSQIFYHDTRGFGTLKFCLSAKALQDKLKTLGPDILHASTTTEDMFVALVAAQKPELNVCKFLMNQKVCYSRHQQKPGSRFHSTSLSHLRRKLVALATTSWQKACIVQ